MGPSPITHHPLPIALTPPSPMAKPSREYIYGINPAFEVIRAGRRTIYEAYVNQAATGNARLKKLASFMDTRGIHVERVDKQRLFQLSKSRENQGVVLKTSTYPYTAFEDLEGSDRLLLLDNVEDPHNVGAVLRSAEIFGFDGVLLPFKGVPDVYPSVVKVSAGASEHLRIARSASANRYVRDLVAQDYTIVALDAKGTSEISSLRDQLSGKLLLVVGGEAASVGQFILNQAHHVARIDQHGRVNSLNASVAAGIAMFALSGETA